MIIWTAAQHVLARYEVETAIARGEITPLPEPCLQGMLAHLLPSVRDGEYDVMVILAKLIRMDTCSRPILETRHCSRIAL